MTQSSPSAMAALFYVLFLRPLSSLPWRVIYAFADVLFLLTYYFPGYRKGVVRENLRNSFPEKDDSWYARIERKFYRQFCDNLLESVKLLSVSQRDVEERMVCENPEVVNELYNKGKDVAIITGHYYSWELWFLAIDKPLKHQVVLIYKALSSAYFENKLKAIRKSFGTEPVEMKSFSSYLEKQKNPIAVIFGADQSHSNVNKSFWTTFLHQETGVVFGPEKFAVTRNAAVAFCQINKKKRGYYKFRYTLLHDGETSPDYGEITKQHVLFLEEVIRNEPQGWLWTHKRWKRKRPEDMPLH